MRMHTRLALLAMAVVLLAIPVSAGAAGIPAVGERINLFDPPATYEAGQPYHVSHGFGAAGVDNTDVSTIPDYQFDLSVDGVEVHGPKTLTITNEEWDQIVWTFNFPEGLEPGDHEFHGVWSGPTFEIEHTIEFTE